MTFNLIVITDSNGGISKNEKIPWYFPDDLSYFKNKTVHSVVIMGKNTFSSLGKPLKHRVNIVVSSTLSSPKGVQLNSSSQNYYVSKSFHEAYCFAKEFSRDIWVIGGKKIYKDALKHYALNKIYRNVIDHDFNCDNFVNFNKEYISWITIHNSVSENRLDGLKYNIKFTIGERKYIGIEQQYLSLLQKTVDNGNLRTTRSGDTISIFSNVLSADLNNGFPLLTTKKMFWKGIVEELLFFIRGDTNTKNLSEKGVKIWEGNTSKEFLESLNLPYEEGYMGPMYGYQWRFFNKEYKDCNKIKYNDNPLSEIMEEISNYQDNQNKGIDQLSEIIEEIKRDKNSRRLMMTNYNPLQVKQGVLYPCHSIILQFYVENYNLSCNMYQRSVDEFLGLPFNIASTSLFLCIIAKLTNLVPRNVNLHLGDCHIYKDHLEQVKTQLMRNSHKLPTLEIPDFKTLEDIENSEFKDYKLENYKFESPIIAKMNV